MGDQTPDYGYKNSDHKHVHAYLLPAVEREISAARPQRIIDIGCGNGSVASHFASKAEVIGIDPSSSGVEIANRSFPNLRIELGSAYDDLPAKYGHFDAVICLEVVEHLYDPRLLAKNIYELLNPGGVAIISTPYHGYLKNLCLAATGALDKHFTALWDGGHIKFWSIKTLTALLEEAGLKVEGFHRVGRLPPLAKSMIAVARRPMS